MSDSDAVLLAALSLDGFIVSQAKPAELASVTSERGVEVIVVDADLPDALGAVSRLRRSDSVISTLPIVLVGVRGVSLRSGIDAVEAGGDAFIPRPVEAAELTARLHGLVDLPSSASGSRPSILPEPVAGESTAIRIPSTPPPRTEEPARPVSQQAPPRERRSSDPPATGAAMLSAELTEILRSAVARIGGDGELSLPMVDDDGVDDLVPLELLEPLDAPADALGEDSLAVATQSTPAGWTSSQPPRRSSRLMASVSGAHPRSGTPTLTPLAIGGDSRLSGALGRYGVGALLGASARARATGLLVIRHQEHEFALTMTAGHLLSISSNRASDEIGPLLARLGAIPREAARFATSPLGTGLRGAAPLAAQGYLAPDALAHALNKAARELLFDLLSLPELRWEMHALETAAEIPLSPRMLDALLVQATRARIEPEAALHALGGESALLTLRADVTLAKHIEFTDVERAGLDRTRLGVKAGILLAELGPEALVALLAVGWLGALRIEGGASSLNEPEPAIADERARVRALLEASASLDFFAILGISEWATRGAAQRALEARSKEVTGLTARHPASNLESIRVALEEFAALLERPEAWQRYVDALRASR